MNRSHGREAGLARARAVGRGATRLLLVVLLVLPGPTGCSSVSRLPLDASLPVAAPTKQAKTLRIIGYTAASDGVFHEGEGTITAVGRDSLRLVFQEEHVAGTLTRTFARREIQSVVVRSTSGSKTTLLVLGVLTVMIALVGVAFATSASSY